MRYEKERQVAIEAVLAACSLCCEVQTNHLSPDALSKRDRTPVTVADFGAQALIIHHIATAFPDDFMVGEEDASLLRQGENNGVRDTVLNLVKRFIPNLDQSEILDMIDRGSGEGGPVGRFWTIDPIDGTKGFLRKDQYAVALALVVEGEVVLGVLGCPNLPLNGMEPNGARGSLFVALRGEGTFLRGLGRTEEKKVQVDELSDPSRSSFCQSVESSHTSHSDAERVARAMGIKKAPIRMDSLCKYGIVARGDTSFYLRIPSQKSYLEKIWDHAAGFIMVQEAGGVVTDIEGRPLDFSLGRTLAENRGILASNGRIHQKVLDTVKRVIMTK